MDVFLFRFDAKKFRAIPSRYLGFLIASGHCCNELTILLPYIVFEHELKSANEAETAFILTRKFTIDRILISKIVEYGELCIDFFRSVEDTSDTLLEELRKNYEPIAAELKSAKWARILRNKISFHYDPAHARKALQDLDDEHALQMVAGPVKGLTLFGFAEEIVSRPIFESAGNGDIGRGMQAVDKFILNLVNSIPRFHANSTISIFKAFGMISEQFPSELREKYCGVPGKTRIPLSVSSAYITERTRRGS